jgi:hypothetical protein
MAINIYGSTRFGPRVVRDGLFLMLDAANTRSYPGTGSTWFDMVGSRTALKAGSQSPTYPQFNGGRYFSFTGGVASNNYSRFDVANIPSFTALSALAVYRTTDTTASKTIIRMNNSDFELSVNGSSSLFIAAGTNWSDVNVQPTQANATDGNWHQIALTFNGQNLIGYFDSAQVGTTTRGSVTATEAGTLRIGTRDDTANQHFVGDIALVAIYNRVLTAAEVALNYRAFKTRA